MNEYNASRAASSPVRLFYPDNLDNCGGGVDCSGGGGGGAGGGGGGTVGTVAHEGDNKKS